LEQLSELCESPFKETKRYQQLKGFALKGIDLERKTWAIEVFINEKEDQVTEKNIILEEVNAYNPSSQNSKIEDSICTISSI